MEGWEWNERAFERREPQERRQQVAVLLPQTRPAGQNDPYQAARSGDKEVLCVRGETTSEELERSHPMIVITPSAIVPGLFLARYGHNPYAVHWCPLHAAWQAIVAARGGGA